MVKLYAGIDAGQSATVAAIGDEQGREIARGSAGPADELGETSQSTRLRDALHAALGEALRSAGLAETTQFASIVAGVSGYDGSVRGAPPALPSANVTLLHDAPVAHAGAFGDGEGIVAIAGTGSVVYARNAEGAALTIGGWGYLFGDEGSGFWLARTAIAWSMRESDAGNEPPLATGAQRHFGVGSLRELAKQYYAGQVTRSNVAEFAASVTAYAEHGDGMAARIVRDGAKLLVESVHSAAARLRMERADVAFLGGVTKSAPMRSAFAASLAELCPGLRLVEPQRDAAGGALLIASRTA